MNAILIVDTVFALRPEYNDCWEYRIWLQVAPSVDLRRGISRDTAAEGIEAATRLHRDRYRAAERVYLAEVGPQPSPASLSTTPTLRILASRPNTPADQNARSCR